MRAKFSLAPTLLAACVAAIAGAHAAVTVTSTNFTFTANWPAGQPLSYTNVPTAPANIALSAAGATPFAIGEYGAPNHTVAHLTDGLYGNPYSWITKNQTLARNVALGGDYGTVNMSFAGVALPNGERFKISDVVFGRTAVGGYIDRIAGRMYLQITTANSVAAITNANAAADAQWTTLGSFTTTDVFQHQFTFTPAVVATGVRIVTAAGNCIDEIVVHGESLVTQTWPSGTVASANFAFSGYWPAGQPVVAGSAFQATPPNLAAATAGATPFAISEYGAPNHTIAHLNDCRYGNTYSWLAATNASLTSRDVALGGFYGTVNMGFAGVALSNATLFTLSDLVFGRTATGEYADRIAGKMYIQITTNSSVETITSTNAAADAQWTTLGYITTTDVYEHQFTFTPAVRATGVRIVTAGAQGGLNGNCIDEIVIHGVPATTPVWDAATADGAATDGAGTWGGEGANWWNGTGNAAWTDGQAAIFGANNGAAGTVEVAGAVAVSGMLFDKPGSGNYTIRGDTLTLAGAPVINTLADASISSVLAGDGFCKYGAGTLTLAGDNSYTGPTVLNQGTLSVGSLANGGIASGIGAASSAAANLVFEGGTLRYTGPTVSTDRKFTIGSSQYVVLDVAEAESTLTFLNIKSNPGLINSATVITKNGPGTLAFGNDGIVGGTAYLGNIAAYVINQGRFITVEDDPSYVNLYRLAPNTALTLGDGAYFGITTTALRFDLANSEQIVCYSGTNLTASLEDLTFCGPTAGWNTKTFDVNDGTSDIDLLMNRNIFISPSGASTQMRKTGAGTLKLAGPTSLYKGTTTIRDGRILVTNSVLSGSASPLGQSSFALQMGEPGTPAASMPAFVFEGDGPFTFSRGVSVAKNGAGALLGCLSDASATFSGPILLSNTVQFLSVATGNNALSVTGAISGPGGVTKTGAGTVVMAAANTYTGLTTVAAGALRLGAPNRIDDANSLRLTGGTFEAAGYSETMGTLEVDGDAVIDFGHGSSALSFSASAAQTWNGTLTIRNWSGSSYGNGTDRLYVGTSSGGLTEAQLAKIAWQDGRKARQLPTGEVVPIPQGTMVFVW